MQIHTWHPPLWFCTHHTKYNVKSGLTNILNNANKTKACIFFFNSDCLVLNVDMHLYAKIDQNIPCGSKL